MTPVDGQPTSCSGGPPRRLLPRTLARETARRSPPGCAPGPAGLARPLQPSRGPTGAELVASRHVHHAPVEEVERLLYGRFLLRLLAQPRAGDLVGDSARAARRLGGRRSAIEMDAVARRPSSRERGSRRRASWRRPRSPGGSRGSACCRPAGPGCAAAAGRARAGSAHNPISSRAAGGSRARVPDTGDGSSSGPGARLPPGPGRPARRGGRGPGAAAAGRGHRPRPAVAGPPGRPAGAPPAEPLHLRHQLGERQEAAHLDQLQEGQLQDHARVGAHPELALRARQQVEAAQQVLLGERRRRAPAGRSRSSGRIGVQQRGCPPGPASPAGSRGGAGAAPGRSCGSRRRSPRGSPPGRGPPGCRPPRSPPRPGAAARGRRGPGARPPPRPSPPRR